MHANPDRRSHSAVIVCWALFFSLHVYLLNQFSPTRAMAPDSASYLAASRSFSEGFDYDSYYRLPLYPYLLASVDSLSENPYSLLVTLQVLMFMLSALVSTAIAKKLCAPFPRLPLCLLLLSPVGAYCAHTILPDALFLFLFSLFLFYFIEAYRSQRFIPSAVSGILLGLCTLTRGNTLYFAFVAPVMYGLFSCFFSSHELFRRRILVGVTVFMLALGSTLLPYAMYNHRIGAGFRIVREEYVNYAVRDNLAMLTLYTRGGTFGEAKEWIATRAQRELGISAGEWDALGRFEQFEKAATVRSSVVAEYSIREVLGSMVQASVAFHFSNGTGSLLRLLIPDYKAFSSEVEKKSLSWDTIEDFIFRDGFTTAIFGLNIFVRVSVLFGFLFLLRNRNWEVLLYCGFFILYFWMLSAFIGSARYRLPVEPLCFIIASFAVSRLLLPRSLIPKSPG